MKTKICVSVFGRDEVELGARVRHALESGGDLVEARLDLVDVSSLEKLKKVLEPYAEKLVLTMRPVGEGGQSTLPAHERLSVLETVSEINPAYIDVELSTAFDNSFQRLREKADGLIVSWHSMNTPSFEELVSKAESCLALGDVAKVVTYSNSVEDSFRVVKLYAFFQPWRLVAFCMGVRGWVTRIVSMAAGAPIAYASLEGLKTAEGQLTLSEMLKARERIVKGVVLE